jgi:flagellar biosynthesis/type III secretory pathway M-ring protein FliF/YscJ
MPFDDKYKNSVDEEYKKADYEARHGFWFVAKWVAASVALVLVIGALIWVITVVSSDTKGAGDAHKQNQSGTNRIAKQEMFQQLYNDIKAADQNVDLMYQTKTDDPSYVNKTNYTGAVAHCRQLVANYNAEAKKYTSADWRDNELPSEIDSTNKQFDCKENNQ